MIDIDIVTNADGWDALPDAINVIHRAVAAAAAQQNLTGDVTVVLTDDEEIRALNRDWRGFDKPTNVLSFPAAPCARQRRSALARRYRAGHRDGAAGSGRGRQGFWPTMSAIWPSTALLHLAGHDHDTDEKAQAMEDLERQILAGLGVGDPYGPN